MGLEAMLPVLMFVVLLALLMVGFPVAFTLAGCAMLFGVIGHFLDLFYISDFSLVPSRIWGVINNFTLVAVPLFVFMGLVLERTGIAEELLEAFSDLFAKVRGNLAYVVVIVGALLAASTGIVGATVVTIGVIALPAMLNRGYNKEFSCGTIAASGTLGQIIPPSIILVLLGDIMNIDVGSLFVGAITPGFVLVLIYLLYIFVMVRINPQLAPATDNRDKTIDLWQIITALVPPFALMVLVLGSILFGFASPTESAACGAVGALLIALIKRKLTVANLKTVMERTARITSMVFIILVGAQFFGVVFRGLAGDELIIEIITNLQVHRAFILFAIMLLMFLLGFFLDFLEICFIIIPIVMPIFMELGYSQSDLLWIAILIALNLQTSFLTPPFGFSLFYLKGVAPKEVTTLQIYKGIIPFVGIQVMALAVIAIFPELVLWLPRLMFGEM